jgi:hypothetical protein
VDNLCLTVTLEDFREGETGHELDRKPEKSAISGTREVPDAQGRKKEEFKEYEESKEFKERTGVARRE